MLYPRAVFALLKMFGLLSVLLYSVDSLKIDSPADITIEHPSKMNEQQPVAIEGRFIVVEGNSDHLFRPYDFIKEEAIQLGEGDTKDIEK